jgi:hypothetical protein
MLNQDRRHNRFSIGELDDAMSESLPGGRIVEVISRPDGATLAEVMKATGWQKHSVRGFISTAGKKLTIESSKSPEGERIYRSIAP